MPHKADVVISGAGLVGSVLALLLEKEGWHVTLIDPKPELPHHDGRVLAINNHSLTLLKKAGVALTGEPIKTVKAYEEGSPWALSFDETVTDQESFGSMVHYDVLREALMNARKQSNSIKIIPSTVQQVTKHIGHTELQLDDNTTVETKLWVGAEGKFSPSRKHYINIRTKTWDYGQHALVFHASHEPHHQGYAYEIFRPDGPLALLPMEGGHQSCIVWNTSTPEKLINLSDQELAKAVCKIFDFYGPLHITSERWSYPLTHLSVSNYVQDRFALVGDAAHVLHPLAGQGVNLGWRDADVLVQNITQSRNLGLDWGSIANLKDFETQQKRDHRKLRFAVNSLHHLFSVPYGRTLRGMGIGLINAITPLKRLLANQAMGYKI